MELVPLIIYWARSTDYATRGPIEAWVRREEGEWNRREGERASRRVAGKPREGDGQGFNSLLWLGKPYPRPAGRMFPFKLLKQPTPLHYNRNKRKN